MEKVLGKFTAEQYWKWRFYAEDMAHADTKAKLAGSQLEILNREQEIHRLKTSLFKNSVNSQQELSNLAKERYGAVRKELEAELGFSIAGCAVDEVTLEIKSFEE